MSYLSDDFKLTADNYYGMEANLRYVSVSQYKSCFGTWGVKGCEAKMMAELSGEIEHSMSTAMMVGSFVDAYFSGELEKFIDEHPEVISSRGATKGQLKAEFEHAYAMIRRAARDDLFMSYMKGDTQTIMTGEIAGVPVKIKIDSFDGNRITDLKTVEDIGKTFYAKDLDQRLNFIEWWAYDLQMAVYREIVRQNTGKEYPCYIAAISKDKVDGEPHPQLAVIEIPDSVMDSKLYEFMQNVPSLQALKEGEREPIPCGHCWYCHDTLPLTRPIAMDELVLNI